MRLAEKICTFGIVVGPFKDQLDSSNGTFITSGTGTKATTNTTRMTSGTLIALIRSLTRPFPEREAAGDGVHSQRRLFPSYTHRDASATRLRCLRMGMHSATGRRRFDVVQSLSAPSTSDQFTARNGDTTEIASPNTLCLPLSLLSSGELLHLLTAGLLLALLSARLSFRGTV